MFQSFKRKRLFSLYSTNNGERLGFWIPKGKKDFTKLSPLPQAKRNSSLLRVVKTRRERKKKKKKKKTISSDRRDSTSDPYI